MLTFSLSVDLTYSLHEKILSWPKSFVLGLLLPYLGTFWDGYHSPLRPDMHRILPGQVFETAALNAQHLLCSPCMNNTSPTLRTEVAVHRPSSLRQTRVNANWRISDGQFKGWEDGRRAKRRGRLSAAFKAVADVDGERLWYWGDEVDEATLASGIHVYQIYKAPRNGR